MQFNNNINNAYNPVIAELEFKRGIKKQGSVFVPPTQIKELNRIERSNTFRALPVPQETAQKEKATTSNTKSMFQSLKDKVWGVTRTPGEMVSEMIDYLSDNNAVGTEGLFRISGSDSNIKKIYTLLKKSKTAIDEKPPVHDVAGVLKRVLRDEKIFGQNEDVQTSYLNAGKAEVKEEMAVGYLKKSVQALKPAQQEVLMKLLTFLGNVESNPETKMTLKNLGICFGPNMVDLDQVPLTEIMTIQGQANTAFEKLISHRKELFSIEAE